MNLPALRASARIAWREAKRAPGRSALVITMVALPITALVFAATVIATAVTTPEESASGQLGTAAMGFYSLERDLARVEAALPPGATVIAERRMDAGLNEQAGPGALAEQYTRAEDQVVFLEYTLPPSSPVLDGIYHYPAGRPPRAPGEAAFHPALLERLGGAVGGRVRIGDFDLRVTGTVLRRLQRSYPNIIVGTGTGLPSNHETEYVHGLVALPEGSDLDAAATALRPIVGDIETRGQWSSIREGGQTFATLAAFAITALALFATGLIVAAAFIVGVRRQVRGLGLLAAAGGERRDVRAVVLAGGATLGLVGSALGVAIGLAGAFAAHGSLHRFTDTVPGPVVVNWVALAGALALGGLSATIAAYVPARAVARLPVTDALAARMPKPRPPGRLAWLGVGIFVIGVPLTASATRGEDQGLLTLGFGALVGGLLLAIPLLVTVIGKLARWLPTSWRLAARDAARQGRRTGAALAAATLVMTAGVGALAAAAGDAESFRRNRPMGDNHIYAHVPGDAGSREARQGFARAFPSAEVVPLERYGYEARIVLPVRVRGSRTTLFRSSLPIEGGLWVGSADLLRAIDAEAGIEALEQGRLVALGAGSTRDGTVRVFDFDEGEKDARAPLDLAAVEVAAPTYINEEIPRFLLSPEAAQRLGFAPRKAETMLVALPEALTAEDIERAREIGAAHGAPVMTAFDWQPLSIPLRIPAVALSGLLALAIITTALALVGAESRRDRAILSAVGAPPVVRRKVAAATAVLLTMVAGLLALPAGFVPYAVTQVSRQDGYPVLVPWDAAIAVVLVVPALAGLAAFLSSRAPASRALLDPLT